MFLAAKYVKKWKEFAKERLKLFSLQKLHAKYVVKRFFNKWLEKYQLHSVLWKKQFILETKKKFLLLQQFLRKWRKGLDQKMKERRLFAERVIIAEKHDRKYRKRFYLKKWIWYIQYRRAKYKQIGLLTCLIVFTLFCNKHNTEKALFLEYRILERKYFELVAGYCIEQQEKREKKVKSEMFRNLWLKRKVFVGFKLFRSLKMKRIQTKQTSADFFEYLLKKRSINSLRKAIELRNWKNNNMNKVAQFRKLHMKQFFLHLWFKNVLHLLHLREDKNISIANQHYYRRLLIFSMSKWINFVGLQKKKLLMKKDAQFFLYCVMFRKLIHSIKHFFILRKHYNKLNKIATEANCKKLISRTFYKWIAKCEKKKNEIKYIEKADLFYFYRRTGKFFAKWHQMLISKIDNFERNGTALEFFVLILKRRYYYKWQDTLERKRKMFKKSQLANMYYRKHLMRLGFSMLLMFHRYKQVKKTALCNIIDECKKQLGVLKLKRSFQNWRKYNSEQAKQVLNKSKAFLLFKKRHLKKYIHFWKIYVNYRYNKQALKISAIEKFRVISLKRNLTQWIMALDLIICFRQKEVKAALFSNRRLISTCLLNWIYFVKWKREFKSQCKEALKYRKRILLKRGLARILAFGYFENDNNTNLDFWNDEVKLKLHLFSPEKSQPQFDCTSISEQPRLTNLLPPRVSTTEQQPVVKIKTDVAVTQTAHLEITKQRVKDAERILLDFEIAHKVYTEERREIAKLEEQLVKTTNTDEMDNLFERIKHLKDRQNKFELLKKNQLPKVLQMLQNEKEVLRRAYSVDTTKI